MRIVVLTNGNVFARIILEQLVAERATEITKIVLITGDYKGRAGLAALRWLARVTTLPYLLYKIATLLVGRSARVAELARQYGIETEAFVAIREEAAMRAVEKATPDLIVSVSCPQVIPERLLRGATRGGINIHSSLLPRFGGLAPYYWVLADGETRTGTTVHFMTRKLDEGNVLGVAEVPIESRDSAFALFTRLARAGAPLLAQAVTRALAGDAGVPMTGERTVRSHPDFASYRRLRRNGHRLVRVRELWRAACETLPPRR
jgi:folate-dependent phosphoribosylglycinamide formyltransferase PurN